MPKPMERQRIAAEVANRLRNLILRGEYQVGEKLPPERKLAEDLGVNRATLREALKNLEQGGLVSIRQGDGTRVLDFLQTAGLDLLSHLVTLGEQRGLSILKDILEFRQIVGRELARLAASRISAEKVQRLQAVAARPAESAEEVLLQDLDFYFELARATDNLVFILLFNPVRAAVSRFRAFFVGFNPSAAQVREHHRELIAALGRGDADAAAQIADAHLQRGKEHVLSGLARREEGER